MRNRERDASELRSPAHRWLTLPFTAHDTQTIGGNGRFDSRETFFLLTLGGKDFFFFNVTQVTFIIFGDTMVGVVLLERGSKVRRIGVAMPLSCCSSSVALVLVLVGFVWVSMLATACMFL